MGLIEEIASAVDVELDLTSGTPLVRIEDADALLGRLETLHCVVLGLEGFRHSEGDLVPDQEAILDLSGVRDSGASILQARAFVHDRIDSQLLVEFVVAEMGQ